MFYQFLYKYFTAFLNSDLVDFGFKKLTTLLKFLFYIVMPYRFDQHILKIIAMK